MGESAPAAPILAKIAPDATPARTEPGVPLDRRRLWIEIVVVLCVGAIPDLTNALLSLTSEDDRESGAFWMSAVALMSRSLQVSAAVLFIMWRSGDGWAHFGLKRPRWLDLPAGLGVFVASLLVYGAYQSVGEFLVSEHYVAVGVQSDAESTFVAPFGAWERLLVVLMSACNGFAEQLVVSAFLVTRLRELLRNPAAAVLLSAMVFGSYHIYQGVFNAASIFVGGLLMGVVFCVSRRLWPLAIAHAMIDAYAYLSMSYA